MAARPTTAAATGGRTRRKGPPGRSPHVLVAVESGSPRVEVLESKLRIPELHVGAVSRTGLVNRLRAEEARLITVIAPAGYGKTTLLAQWSRRDDRPFAWLTLDEHDNDARILLSHLAAAYARVGPLRASVDDALASSRSSVWRAAAPRLAATVASSEQPFVFVLDDADVVRRGEARDVLNTLAKSIPEGSALVLAGRSAAPLPVARLRATGWLRELGAADLAMSRREAFLVLGLQGKKLDEEDLLALVEKTEGWAAGLCLAGLALDTDGSAARELDGSDRYISEYFHSEHLSRIPEERLAFLRRTSILERLTAGLCDATLASTGAADELAALERANLFLVPLDRRATSFRYHRLLRDVLRLELERREPELVPVLHERAAHWLETQGELEPALEHALAGKDAARAARLLAAVGLAAYHDGRVETVERWLARFEADHDLHAHPEVAVLGAGIHALRGRARESRRWVRAATSRKSTAAAVRASAALVSAMLGARGVKRMRTDVERALAALPDDSPWLPLAFVVAGAAAKLSGDAALADERLKTAADAGERLGEPEAQAVALAQRSTLRAVAGDDRAADELAVAARDVLAASTVGSYATTGIAHATAARALLRTGRWDDARRELASAEESAEVLTESMPWLAAATRLAIANAHVMLRDRSGAVEDLAELRKIVAAHPEVDVGGEEAAALEQQIEALPDGRDGRAAALTTAELRLLPLLATHLSFREIGERLFVSRNTIKTQAISAYRKLGVSSRGAAIERASELGLLEDAAQPAHFIRTR